MQLCRHPCSFHLFLPSVNCLHACVECRKRSTVNLAHLKYVRTDICSDFFLSQSDVLILRHLMQMEPARQMGLVADLKPLLSHECMPKTRSETRADTAKHRMISGTLQRYTTRDGVRSDAVTFFQRNWATVLVRTKSCGTQCKLPLRLTESSFT